MNSSSSIHRKLPLFVALSILGHVLLFYPFCLFHTYNFAPPVIPAIMVDLKQLTTPQPSAPTAAAVPVSQQGKKAAVSPLPAAGAPQGGDAKPAENAKSETAPKVQPTAQETAAARAPARPEEKNPAPAAAAPAAASLRRENLVQPPLIQPGSVVTTKREKLTYSITAHSLTVGKAELEAVNEKGDVKITMKASSEGFGLLYPVDNYVETKVSNGNFITTKIKRHEGSVNSDLGFTISLREKFVMWFDFMTKKSGREPLPADDVFDMVSAFYLLRTKPLQVGTPVVLHVYDYAFSALPVDVLRRETMRLPGLGEIGALVVQPQFQQDGMFRKTSNMLVWLSDDEKHVPLKVETDIPVLGRVTATLVNAESEPNTQPPPR